MRYEGGQYYLKSEEEMRELFSYAPQALDNTHKIAERCNVEIEFGVTKLPKYDVPEGFTSESYLEHLCMEGLVKRYGERAAELEERLDYELSVIKKWVMWIISLSYGILLTMQKQWHSSRTGARLGSRFHCCILP